MELHKYTDASSLHITQKVTEKDALFVTGSEAMSQMWPFDGVSLIESSLEMVWLDSQGFIHLLFFAVKELKYASPVISNV